jgi:hypothetical protein
MSRTLGLLASLATSGVAAASPTALQHQGRLIGPDGSAVQGEHTLTLSLYSAASGGTALCSEQQVVAVQFGYFSASIGGDGCDVAAIDFAQGLWVGVAVDSAAELAPRSELFAVPVALTALSGGSVVDRAPNTVSFAATPAALGATVTSASATLSGFDGPLVATVVGAGEPLISVDGGPFAPAAVVSPGSSVALRVTAPDRVGSRVISLVVGDATAAWTVNATATNATCKTLLDSGVTTNGTQTIDPDGPGGAAAYSVYCDMTGGGWTYAALNTPFRVGHTGGPAHLVSPVVPTTFEFTVYGAAGGPASSARDTDPNNSYRPRSFGGMARGRVALSPRTPVYLYAGGMGQSGAENDRGESYRAGGFNGGGGSSRGGSSGGGASDVRVGDSLLTSRILVGGGGGGCGYEACNNTGGTGGGLTGGTGQTSPTGLGATGGTQTSGGAPQLTYTTDESILGVARGGFGFGGTAIQINDEAGGGGGWYGGGAGGHHNTTGGGGSSYVGGVTSSTQTPGVNNAHGYVTWIFQ